MRASHYLTAVLALAILLSFSTSAASAQGPKRSANSSLATGTAFTYQGQLKRSSNPVNGACDFQFSLWDSLANTTGTVGSMVPKTGIQVTNGLFSVALDFGGGTFTGEARWLQIAVKCAGDASFVALTPRQELTAAPYAMHSANADTLDGQHGAAYWNLNGNGGTTSNFIGTTDDVSMTLRVNNVVGWRLAPSGTDTPNLIGGYSGNSATSGTVGATIGGGGEETHPNQVTAWFGVVGGGHGNTASGDAATVGGGYYNRAFGNTATIGGGFNNWTLAERPTVGGGGLNFAYGDYSTISGGSSNEAAGQYATVGGGRYNKAGGYSATVAGGLSNSANGDYSFVVGRRAKNTDFGHAGVFIFADSTDADFTSTAANQFLVRAGGGVGINTNTPVANTLTVGGDGLRVATDGTTLKRIQAGQASLGTGVTGVNVYTVTFPVAFSCQPKVVVTPLNDPAFDNGNDNDLFALSLRKIYADKFVVNLYRIDNVGGGWAQNLKLDWYAWE